MSGVIRFAKFNLVGLLGTVLQLILFSLLVKNSHWPETAASLLAVEAAVLHNFLWHERFTWGDLEATGFRQRAVRLWRFHAGNGLISLAGNTSLTYIFMEWLGAPPVTSAVCGIALCAPVNFLLADRWVYRANQSPRDNQPDCGTRITM